MPLSRSTLLAARPLLRGILAATVLGGATVGYAAPASQRVVSTSVAPTRVATAGQSRCGPALATLGTNCLGFDGRDVRALSDLWVVGFENNRDVGEKHVLQTVAAFNLAPLRNAPPRATVSRAVLSYSEASTVHRSPSGDAEYGILATCNTNLGVPTPGWNGNLAGVVPTVPAAVAGVQGATTGDTGAWDVTPQVRQWLADSSNEGTFVLRGDDESMDVAGLAMCLSYVFDLNLGVEFTVPD
jgi:hypothetical protein